MHPIRTLTKTTFDLVGCRSYWALAQRIFMVSSLAPEHVVNLVTLVPNQAIG
jgi:hypothetical protein